jgi:hypothetical protein
MVQQAFARLFTRKTLLRVASVALSLGGVAHAQSLSRTDGATMKNTQPAPLQQGNAYNFTAGGGG